MRTLRVGPDVKLEFMEPVFAPGQQTTVRLGDKWKNLIDSGVKSVRICETGKDATLAEANIDKYEYCKFSDLPKFVLDNEHSPSCHTMDGLRQAMINAYGDKFNDNSMVTAVVFTVIDENELVNSEDIDENELEA